MPPSGGGTSAGWARRATARPGSGTRGRGAPGRSRPRPVPPGCARAADLAASSGLKSFHLAREWSSLTCRDRVAASSVADRAIRELLGLDVVFLDELTPQRRLVAGRHPVHQEDRFPGTHVPFGMAMTVQAPFHGHGLLLPDQRHLVDPAVAGDAGHALLDMDPVMEVDEVGDVVDPAPGQRSPLPEAGPDRLEHGAVRPDLG